MNKYLPLSLLLIIVLTVIPVMSQKVTVDLKRSKESSVSFWQITDENETEVISANSHLNEDTVTFSLLADRFYSLRIIVQDTTIPVTLSYTLAINGEDILQVTAKPSDIRNEYKFFSGIPRPISKITGGYNASIADFPWQVAFFSGGYLCGASIIAPGWVVTAAHCTEDASHIPIPAASMKIIVGTATPLIAGQGKTYSISEVIRNEFYSFQTLENDIALLRLQQPISYPNATPINLISQYDVSDGASAPGVMSWVTGFGLISVAPQILAPSLQKVQLPIVSNALASVVWPSIPFSSIMAGYKTGNKDACMGDSGGPLVVPVTGEYKLAGIVSWGRSTCDTYSGYTRVSDYLTWISGKTGIVYFRPDVPYGSTVICNSADTTAYSVEPYPSATNYQWKLYPEAAGTISGSSTSARVSWNQSFTGTVQVMVRTTANNLVSDWSKLKVLVSPEIKIIASSNDITVCPDQPVTLVAKADGVNLSYKWYRNNTLIQSATSDFITFPSVKNTNAGVYRCDISDVCSTISTNDINLNVLTATTISALTPDMDVPIGDNPTLEVTSQGDKLSFQWKKEGIAIPDAVDPALHLYDVNTTDIGLYSVIVKGTCGTLTSDSIYVYVMTREATGLVDVLVWPTVASEEFNIAVSNDETYTVLMYNTKGSLIREMKNCRYQTTIYAGTLPAGTFIIKVFGTGFSKSVKVIKN